MFSASNVQSGDLVRLNWFVESLPTFSSCKHKKIKCWGYLRVSAWQGWTRQPEELLWKWSAFSSSNLEIFSKLPNSLQTFLGWMLMKSLLEFSSATSKNDFYLSSLVGKVCSQGFCYQPGVSEKFRDFSCLELGRGKEARLCGHEPGRQDPSL